MPSPSDTLDTPHLRRANSLAALKKATDLHIPDFRWAKIPKKAVRTPLPDGTESERSVSDSLADGLGQVVEGGQARDRRERRAQEHNDNVRARLTEISGLRSRRGVEAWMLESGMGSPRESIAQEATNAKSQNTIPPRPMVESVGSTDTRSSYTDESNSTEEDTWDHLYVSDLDHEWGPAFRSGPLNPRPGHHDPETMTRPPPGTSTGEDDTWESKYASHLNHEFDPDSARPPVRRPRSAMRNRDQEYNPVFPRRPGEIPSLRFGPAFSMRGETANFEPSQYDSATRVAQEHMDAVHANTHRKNAFKQLALLEGSEEVDPQTAAPIQESQEERLLQPEGVVEPEEFLALQRPPDEARFKDSMFGQCCRYTKLTPADFAVIEEARMAAERNEPFRWWKALEETTKQIRRKTPKPELSTFDKWAMKTAVTRWMTLALRIDKKNECDNHMFVEKFIRRKLLLVISRLIVQDARRTRNPAQIRIPTHTGLSDRCRMGDDNTYIEACLAHLDATEDTIVPVQGFENEDRSKPVVEHIEEAERVPLREPVEDANTNTLNDHMGEKQPGPGAEHVEEAETSARGAERLMEHLARQSDETEQGDMSEQARHHAEQSQEQQEGKDHNGRSETTQLPRGVAERRLARRVAPLRITNRGRSQTRSRANSSPPSAPSAPSKGTPSVRSESVNTDRAGTAERLNSAAGDRRSESALSWRGYTMEELNDSDNWSSNSKGMPCSRRRGSRTSSYSKSPQTRGGTSNTTPQTRPRRPSRSTGYYFSNGGSVRPTAHVYPWPGGQAGSGPPSSLEPSEHAGTRATRRPYSPGEPRIHLEPLGTPMRAPPRKKFDNSDPLGYFRGRSPSSPKIPPSQQPPLAWDQVSPPSPSQAPPRPGPGRLEDLTNPFRPQRRDPPQFNGPFYSEHGQSIVNPQASQYESGQGTDAPFGPFSRRAVPVDPGNVDPRAYQYVSDAYVPYGNGPGQPAATPYGPYVPLGRSVPFPPTNSLPASYPDPYGHPTNPFQRRPNPYYAAVPVLPGPYGYYPNPYIPMPQMTGGQQHQYTPPTPYMVGGQYQHQYAPSPMPYMAAQQQRVAPAPFPQNPPAAPTPGPDLPAAAPGQVSQASERDPQSPIFVVLGWFQDELSEPAEICVVVEDSRHFLPELKKHIMAIRGWRSIFSFKTVQGFGLYRCRPKQLHHDIEQLTAHDSRTLARFFEATMSASYTSSRYRPDEASYHGPKTNWGKHLLWYFSRYQDSLEDSEYLARKDSAAWAEWVHVSMNNAAEVPFHSSLSLRLVMKVSRPRIACAGLMMTALSFVVGLWFMAHYEGVEGASAAWTIASYVLTAGAFITAILAVYAAAKDGGKGKRRGVGHSAV